jgi:hypothetical protein
MKNYQVLFSILFFPSIISAQQINIKGKVADREAQALVGASVAVYKNDSVLAGGTISDAEGGFVLKDLPAGDYKLVISYVGFAANRIQLSNLRKDLDLGTLSLQADTELNEVVVTGFGKRYEVNRQILIPTENLTSISNNAMEFD